MLTCLRVKNLAIIDELEVEFGPGLNVVTGETGAGKSILVDALELVLGGKGKPELVRAGAKAAEVEALFVVKDAAITARLEEAGVELEEGGELIIRRVLPLTGRSRAYINGRMATSAELTALAEGLADISSQHEHHMLANPATHLDYLDAFAKLEPLRDKVTDAHGRARAARDALEALRAKVRDRGEREDLLRFQIKEIDALSPVPGEAPNLANERERLRHAEKLSLAAGNAEDALYAGDEALCTTLGRIAHDVRNAAHIDKSLEPIADQIDQAVSTLEDAAKDLGRYARGIDVDPGRLTEVDDRLDAIKRLERKYGGTVEAILARREEAAAELETLEHHEERLAAAESALAAVLAEARTLALGLRDKRMKASAKLGEAISKELASLGMGDARIEVAVAPLEGRGDELEIDGARLSPTGIDRAEFLISPNRGEEARPLRKVASGGELSRAMLAIKRVLSGLGPSSMYVFDEVDTGVGGAVAEVIGQKLLDVARHHQVVCVTHLAQIAVYGDGHFHVRKRVVDDRTRSEVHVLVNGERLEEIARMLGGVTITAKTRAAAEELLEQAAKAKKPKKG